MQKKPFICVALLLGVFSMLNSTALVAEADSPKVFPSLVVRVDGERLLDNTQEYSYNLSRVLWAEIFQAGNFTLASSIAERTRFGGTDRNPSDPEQIRYYIDYLDLQYAFAPGVLSVLWDHICNNAIDRNAEPELHNNFFRLGVKWQSRGMIPSAMIARRDPSFQHFFPFLDGFDASVSAGYIYSTWNLTYNAYATADFNYDITDFYGIIPYVGASFEAFHKDSVRVSRSFELGGRYLIDRIELTPYFRYSYQHDLEYQGSESGKFYSYGLRAQAPFFISDSPESLSRSTESNSILDPALHVDAEYARYLASSYLCYHSNLTTRLDFFESAPVTPFIKADLSHDSWIDNQSMWPRYLQYSAGGGLFARAGTLVRFSGYAERFHRNEGNYYKGYREKWSRAAGAISYGMDQAERSVVGATIDGGAFFQREHQPYQGDASGEFALRLYSSMRATPYFRSRLHLFFASTIRKEYAFEGGVLLPAAVQTSFFFRYEQKIDIDRIRGISEQVNMLGISLSI